MQGIIFWPFQTRYIFIDVPKSQQKIKDLEVLVALLADSNAKSKAVFSSCNNFFQRMFRYDIDSVLSVPAFSEEIIVCPRVTDARRMFL